MCKQSEQVQDKRADWLSGRGTGRYVLSAPTERDIGL
jgi:hypothetical protein